MARPRASNTGPSPVQIVERTLAELRPGLNEHQLRINRFNREYEVYRGTVKLPRNMKPWQSRLYVKYGMQIIDQALVNMAQGTPKAICKPRREQDQIAAKGMELALGYYSDMDHLAEAEGINAFQSLVFGVAPAKNYWLYKEQPQRSYAPAIDEDSGAVVWKPGVQDVVTADRPCHMPWDAYDCWWEPYARDVDTAAYVVLRSWMTKDELNDRRYNAENGIGVYRNLDLLFSTGQSERPSPTAQNQLLGSTDNLYKDRFEIWEVWRDDRLTVIGSRKVLLYDGIKPFWMPGKPVVIGNTRQDMFKIEGVSETELVDHLQQALWTVTNLRMDNWKFVVQRGATVRETVPDMSQLVMRPAFLWPVTDHGDVQFHDAPPLPSEAYQEEDVLLSRLQYITGITPYVTGAPNPGVDQNTATGVSLLQESASRLLTFKANRVRMLIWQRTYEQWADLTRQFLTKPMSVRIEGPGNAVSWMDVGPDTVSGDFDIRIEAGEESLSRQQERAEAVALLNALAPFAQAGLVSVQPLLEKVAQAYDFPSVSSLFPQQQQQQPQGAPYPTGPTPFTLGNGLAPNPAQALLGGNAR